MGTQPVLQGSPTFDNFEFVKKGSTSITLNSGAASSTTVIIAHGLNFIPIPFAFMFDGLYYSPLPTWTGLSYSGSAVQFNTWIQIQTDATNVYIQGYQAPSTSSGPFPIIYFLYRNKIN